MHKCFPLTLPILRPKKFSLSLSNVSPFSISLSMSLFEYFSLRINHSISLYLSISLWVSLILSLSLVRPETDGLMYGRTKYIKHLYKHPLPGNPWSFRLSHPQHFRIPRSFWPFLSVTMVNMSLTSSLARPISPYSHHLFAVACCIFKVSPDLQALMSYPCLQKLTIYNIKIYAEHIKYTYIFCWFRQKTFKKRATLLEAI